MHVSVLGIIVFLHGEKKFILNPMGGLPLLRRHVPAGYRTSNLLIAKIILYPLDNHGRYETLL